MNNNKEVLKYCPNYYNIVNFNFNNDDVISDKLINVYKNFIFSIDLNNLEDIKTAENLDHVLSNYIKDYIFRNTLQKEILSVKVRKDSNVLKNIVDAILRIFNNYEEYTTRKIYISKWI